MRAIVVFYDSLNKRYLPPYGNEQIDAPNFRRLAEHAVTFDNSFVGSMPCMPARREMHTGRYNFLHREWGPLEPFDDSLPELLQKAGVYTHLVSDHLHYWEDGGATYHNRYSSWEIVRGQEGDHWKGQVAQPDIPPVVRVPNKQTGQGTSGLWRYDWVNRQYIKTERDQPQTKVFDHGCDFIRKNAREDNWLLQIETFDPHEPFYVFDNYLRKYKGDYNGPHFDWPRGKVEESDEVVEHVRRQYAALVSMCDHNLGRVLDLMDEYDLWKDTLLIVGTDHGFLLGEHGYWAKNQMPYYNEIANTPLFIWDPRSHKQNERRAALVQMIDWAPTILEYFNLAIPEDMQGCPLKETIERDAPVRDACLFGVFSGHVNVTDGKYVYMRAPNQDRNELLYNYTLMPTHMTQLFNTKELSRAEFTGPLSFTKGCKVLKTPAKDKYGVGRFGTLLFDIEQDPHQLTPLHDEAVEHTMIKKLLALMKSNDAPPEQYVRLGLEDYKDR
jgi:Arylsulfatase A and related enzymes